MNDRMTKNYTEQGGDVTVIGGTLRFEDGATVENFPGGGGEGGSYTLPTASDTVLGGIKIGDGVYMVGDKLNLFNATTRFVGGLKAAVNQEDSTASDVEGLVADFNALLASLRTAGILQEAAE